MPLLLEGVASSDEAANENPEPCVVCTQKPAECGVWGLRVCYPCAAHWAEHSPTYGDLEARFGAEVDAPKEFRRFTDVWAEARRAKARAA